MSVEASVVYALANETGQCIDICKVALERSKNDTTAARLLLQKWHNSKSSNSTKNEFGIVRTYFDKDHNSAAVVKVSCTNELVSSSKEFIELANAITSESVCYDRLLLTEEPIKKLEQAYNCSIIVDKTRFARKNKFSLLTTHTHRGMIGSMVEIEVDNEEAFNNKLFRTFSFDCAMHVTAFNPLGVNKEHIPTDIRHQVIRQIEKELARENKDIRYWPTAIEGKLNKWAERRFLLTQIFIRSEAMTLDDVRKNIINSIGSDIRINRIARLQVEN